MAMVCPHCQDSFDKGMRCPVCGVRLQYLPETRTTDASRWQQTPWGRILIGLVTTQGLYHCLRHLCTAGLLASGDFSAQSIWTTLQGFFLLQLLQAVALVIGGMIVGAGERQGTVFGAIMGGWNGIISLLAHKEHTVFLGGITLYAQPILQTALGALGGLIGSSFWKPVPTWTTPDPVSVPQTHIAKPRRSSPFSGPISWGRVLVGTTVAVAGTLWANVILDLVLEASEGKLNVETHLQAKMVTWEIIALAMLVGGALAGANTANGPKQGLCVGGAAAILLFGFRLNAVNVKMQTLLLTSLAAVVLGLAGGWFGSQLFPPLIKTPRRRGIHSSIG